MTIKTFKEEIKSCLKETEKKTNKLEEINKSLKITQENQQKPDKQVLMYVLTDI